MTERTVLVTGGGGFLGGRLVEATFLSGFGTARAGIRRWASASRVARYPVDFIECDIMDPEMAKTAVVGADVVVHCAYRNNRESIVEGTRNMLEAALAAGVERFVFISSAEVYGPEAAGVVDETFDCGPTGRSYGDAKLEAEALVADFYERGLPTTVLRPSIIYGPFGDSWTINVATKLQSGNWRSFAGHGDGICNLVHVDDLVRAIFHCIEDDRAVGETFNVVGPERPTWNEYFAAFNQVLGREKLPEISGKRARQVSMVRDRVGRVAGALVDRFKAPLMRVYLRGGFASDVMKRVRDRLKSTPTTAELAGLYSRTTNLSTQRIESTLGFFPKIAMTDGLEMCRQWLDFHGYLVDG